MKDKNKLGIILDYCNILSVTDSIFKRPIKYMPYYFANNCNYMHKHIYICYTIYSILIFLTEYLMDL